MLRSRSSGLLPVTHSTTFPRQESRLFRRRAGGGQAVTLPRLLTYLLVSVLLAGSIYGVTRLGQPGLPSAADNFGLAEEDAFLDGAAAGGSSSRSSSTLRRRQQERLHGSQDSHDLHDLHDMHSVGGGDAWRHEDDGPHRQAAAQQQHHRSQRRRQEERDAEQDHGHAFKHSDDVEAWDAIAGEEEAGHEAQHAQQHGAAPARGAQHSSQALQQQEQQAEQASLEAQHLQDLHALESKLGGPGSLARLHPDPQVAAAVATHIVQQQAMPRRQGPSLYTANLSAVDIHGQVVHTGDLMGRVTLVVNVASQCGYTDSNYRGLKRVYDRYKEFGLEVLAFPCNQFGQQEPGSHAEIEQFVASRYGATFPLMSKVEVNGPSQHPVFAWLKANTPPEPGHPENQDVQWNFAKFLIDKHGHPVKRYSSDLVYHDLELDVYNELIKL